MQPLDTSNPQWHSRVSVPDPHRDENGRLLTEENEEKELKRNEKKNKKNKNKKMGREADQGHSSWRPTRHEKGEAVKSAALARSVQLGGAHAAAAAAAAAAEQAQVKAQAQALALGQLELSEQVLKATRAKADRQSGRSTFFGMYE
jgi:hypothetical protein